MKSYRNGLCIFITLFLLLPLVTVAQEKVEWRVVSQGKPEIQFPDIPGYITLVGDFHTHTVFSDGMVWPTVRLDEAVREGLDALAISDHIEYQPHKDDIPTKHNRPYELVNNSAKYINMLFPRGTEITKDTPPGHFNAIFLKDVDPVDTKDITDACRIATEQGAFVFWNHPGWQGLERGRWREVHTTMNENRWLHGIEVANGGTYYPEAHQWALDKNLTMMGSSDIHSPALDRPRTPENHRTTTLVFVRERSLQALKEALFAGRTVAWYKNQLIGREKYLNAIFYNAVTVSKPHHKNETTAWMEIQNRSELNLELKRTGTHGPATLALPAKKTIVLRMKSKEALEDVKLTYEVTNFLVAPEKGLPVEFTISLE